MQNGNEYQFAWVAILLFIAHASVAVIPKIENMEGCVIVLYNCFLCNCVSLLHLEIKAHY